MVNQECLSIRPPSCCEWRWGIATYRFMRTLITQSFKRGIRRRFRFEHENEHSVADDMHDLIEGIRESKVQPIRTYLALSNHISDGVDPFPGTLLPVTGCSSCAGCSRYLINSGVSIDFSRPDSYSPLHRAICFGITR